MLAQVKELLINNNLCVLCTTNGAIPYCSLMTYALSDDYKIVYMVTVRHSRKYKNLLENSTVSLLVDNRQKIACLSNEKVASVTFEGLHKPLDFEETAHVHDYLMANHLELKEILNNVDCVIFGIALKSFLLLSDPVNSVQGML